MIESCGVTPACRKRSESLRFAKLVWRSVTTVAQPLEKLMADFVRIVLVVRFFSSHLKVLDIVSRSPQHYLACDSCSSASPHNCHSRLSQCSGPLAELC